MKEVLEQWSRWHESFGDNDGDSEETGKGQSTELCSRNNNASSLALLIYSRNNQGIYIVIYANWLLWGMFSSGLSNAIEAH